MVGTKAPWFRTIPGTAPRADPPVRGVPTYPGLTDGDSKRKGRDNRERRRNREPQRKPGGAPKYKPYDYPQRPARPKPVPKPTPEIPLERAPRPVRPRYPSIPGGVGGAVAAVGLIDLIDNVLHWPNPGLNPKLPPNYVWCNGPWPTTHPLIFQPNRVFAQPGGPGFVGGGDCSIPPISSQSTAYPMVGNRLKLTDARHYWWWAYTFTNTTGSRGAALGTVERIGPAISPQPSAYWPVVDYGAMSNPNYERIQPGTSPYPLVTVRPAPQVGVGEPLAQPEPFANPELAYSPDYAWQYELGVGVADIPGNTPGTGTPNPPPGWRPRLPPAGRKPPRKRERQRKVLTRTAKIGIALYRALDGASESAEVVDALYDALPEDVRKRWDRDDRMGDSFGQYGVDGADWKLQALYYNWHNLDVVQAIKNIIKNQLADSVVGGMQGVLPRNAGAAHSLGEEQLSKLLDEWLSENLGL